MAAFEVDDHVPMVRAAGGGSAPFSTRDEVIGMELTGFHHLTAVSARIRDNLQFYTEVMGMRLVKRSVNQDDVSAYHLFYADRIGTPGTDLTFFDWPARPERRGTRSVVRTGLRVEGEESLQWWVERLTDAGVETSGVVEQGTRSLVEFEDPEGQRLALVDDGGIGDPPEIWPASPVPARHQVRGLGPITMSVPELEPSHEVLTGVMSMTPAGEYEMRNQHGVVHIYRMGGKGPHAELHVAVQPHLQVARLGAGGVHHVAFRTPDDDEYRGWADRLVEMGVPNSGPVNRFYFQSLYFREPGGILFEIATDGPGFTVDEAEETLGEEVALPPFLEPRRAQIVAGLEPLE